MPQYPHSEVFALLPEQRPAWRKFLFSTAIQSLVVLLAAWWAALHPFILHAPRQNDQVTKLVVTPSPPSERASTLPAPLHRSTPRVEAQSVPVLKVKPDFEVKPPAIPQVPSVHLPVQPAAAAMRSLPSSPDIRPVAKEFFSAASSTPSTTNHDLPKVQTGGFDAPNGVPASNQRETRPNIARAGVFDSATGSGHGESGRTAGPQSVVASSGFGNASRTGTATPGPGSPVQAAGFAPEIVETSDRPRPSPVSPTTVPAEILSKPVPVYTDEARRMHIQGEVLLDVVLEASGAIRVLGVVHGLGYGLDKAALQAAEHIRFKPALQDGHPSDSRVILHIVFQLA